MVEKRRRSGGKLMTLLIVFLLGGAVGYYVRDSQQRERVEDAVGRARRDMERASLEAIERARRAGGDFRAGAQAAAESTKAAFRELVGDSSSR